MKKILVLALVALALPFLGGCRDASLSDKEVKQIQQGPPKEMPPEAIRAMQNARKGAPPPGVPTTPPGR